MNVAFWVPFAVKLTVVPSDNVTVTVSPVLNTWSANVTDTVAEVSSSLTLASPTVTFVVLIVSFIVIVTALVISKLWKLLPVVVSTFILYSSASIIESSPCISKGVDWTIVPGT